jgi:glutathione peroxidase
LTSLYDVEISRLDGSPLDLAAFRDDALLIVNVASACGLTPQYEALQRLYELYRPRGLTVLGVPCNQFGEQEPGSPDEIAGFCSRSYSVTFPLTEKVDVNGARRHPLYRSLTLTADAEGRAGDVQWNFEKFLVSPQGDVLRFRPLVAPDSDEVVTAIEASLPR